MRHCQRQLRLRQVCRENTKKEALRPLFALVYPFRQASKSLLTRAVSASVFLLRALTRGTAARATGALCYLDVRDMQLDIWKQLIHHKNKWLSQALKAVIDYIAAKDFSA